MQRKKQQLALLREKRRRALLKESGTHSSDSEFKGIQTPEDSSEIDDYQNPEVFIFPCFMKPGRQRFLVGDSDGEYYLHRMLAP